MIVVSWLELKQMVVGKFLEIQYIDSIESYKIWVADNGLVIRCDMNKFPSDTTDLIDFETNFKPIANKPISSVSSPFSSKVVGSKKIYKRLTGIQSSLMVGENAIIFTVPFSWVKTTGIDIVGGAVGDKISVSVLDSVSGSYSGQANRKLNQFGFNVNVAPGFYEQKSSYDADLYFGMQIEVVYTSVSIKTIGINIDMNEVK